MDREERKEMKVQSRKKELYILRICKVRVQKYSSDTLSTPKVGIVKQTILNTAYDI